MDTHTISWDEARVLALIANKTQESLTLDYKRSPSLDRSDGKRAELSKDVSAFANSAGGIIVHGMEENGHVPIRIDGGYDPNDITKEWLEDIITSWIHPRVDGLRIYQVHLSDPHAGRVAYVIEIPPARSLAPHQASDHKYYKRFNFKSVPMEDYEVRDLLRRATAPDLRCRLLIGLMGAYNRSLLYDHVIVGVREGRQYSEPIRVQLGIENVSPAPAEYAIFTIDCPTDLLHVSSMAVGMNGAATSPMTTRFVHRHGVPHDFPLWQGEIWLPDQAYFSIAIPDRLTEGSWDFSVTASAPGFRRSSRVRFVLDYDILSIVP